MTPSDDLEPSRGDGAAGAVDVLVVSIFAADGIVRCAILARHVRGVARMERVTRYPGAPADVPGVTALGGQVVAVLYLTAPDAAAGPAVLVSDGVHALALAGGAPARVTAATPAGPGAAADQPRLRLWSGRELPLAGAVRLVDASRPDAADGPSLPLLDTAALITAAVDDTDGGR